MCTFWLANQVFTSVLNVVMFACMHCTSLIPFFKAFRFANTSRHAEQTPTVSSSPCAKVSYMCSSSQYWSVPSGQYPSSFSIISKSSAAWPPCCGWVQPAGLPTSFPLLHLLGGFAFLATCIIRICVCSSHAPAEGWLPFLQALNFLPSKI